ncbi:MAG: DUF222 domain-containing protein, partial [Jatrophihabitans sp.]
ETVFGKGGDPRTADQRRADALITMAETILGDPCLTRRHGARPAVQLTVAASTLLGLDEQPGELAGYGPIPAQMARRISQDETGTWRRLITDDHGRLVDYGSNVYRPPARLVAFIIARDQTCTFTSCTRPAVACDLDHRVSAKDGGTTCPGNLHPLPAAPPLQTPNRLAPPTTTRRIHHLDQPHRPHLPHPPRPTTHHHRPQATAIATRTSRRPRPTAVLTVTRRRKSPWPRRIQLRDEERTSGCRPRTGPAADFVGRKLGWLGDEFVCE